MQSKSNKSDDNVSEKTITNNQSEIIDDQREEMEEYSVRIPILIQMYYELKFQYDQVHHIQAEKPEEDTSQDSVAPEGDFLANEINNETNEVATLDGFFLTQAREKLPIHMSLRVAQTTQNDLSTIDEELRDNYIYVNSMETGNYLAAFKIYITGENLESDLEQIMEEIDGSRYDSPYEIRYHFDLENGQTETNQDSPPVTTLQFSILVYHSEESEVTYLDDLDEYEIEQRSNEDFDEIENTLDQAISNKFQTLLKDAEELDPSQSQKPKEQKIFI